MKPRPVEIRIRELVVQGFARPQAARVAAEIERALAARFAEPVSRLVSSRTAAPVRLEVPAAGRAMAGAVGGGIARAVAQVSAGSWGRVAPPGGKR